MYCEGEGWLRKHVKATRANFIMPQSFLNWGSLDILSLEKSWKGGATVLTEEVRHVGPAGKQTAGHSGEELSLMLQAWHRLPDL